MEAGSHGIVAGCSEKGRGALLGHRREHARARGTELGVDGVPDVAQIAGLEPFELGNDQLVARNLDRRCDGGGDGVGGTAGEGLLELGVRLAQLALECIDAAADLNGDALKTCRSVIEERNSSRKPRKGSGARHGLDTTDVRAGGRLGDDAEQAEFGGVAGMGAAAKFTAEGGVLISARNHAHHVAVLLAKECHSARSLGFLDTAYAGDDGLGSEDLSVDQALDLTELLGREGLEMREVKAQVLVAAERTGLVHMLTEHVLKRGIEQVGSGVVTTDKLATAHVDARAHGVADMHGTARNGRDMGEDAVVALRIGNLDLKIFGGKGTGIAHLATHLGIERRTVEHDLNALASLCRIDALAVAHDGNDLGAIDRVVVVTAELGGGELVGKRDPDIVEGTPCVALDGGTGALLLSGHGGVETIHIDCMARSLRDLDGKVDREPEGVVKHKGGIARELFAFGEFGQALIKIGATVVERGREALFLGGDDTVNERDVLQQIGIGVAHEVVDGVDEGVEEGAFDPEQATMEDGAAEKTAEHVLAALVARKDTVRDHEIDRTRMVGDDTQRPARALIGIGIVGLSGDLLAERDQPLHEVAVVVGALVLHDGGHALETHARIEVAVRKLGHGAVFLTIVLGEHEVPELEEAIAVATRGAVGASAADLLALVEIDLGTGSAGAGGAGGPEVVVLAQAGDVVLGNTEPAPDIARLVILGENGEVEALDRELELLGDELESPLASLLLGDAAEGEVAEHLEERKVAAILADAVDVVGAHALLAGARTDLGHGLLALVVLLELVHAGVGKQERGVIGHERGARIELEASLLEEIKERRADLGGGHSRKISGHARVSPRVEYVQTYKFYHPPRERYTLSQISQARIDKSPYRIQSVDYYFAFASSFTPCSPVSPARESSEPL